MRKLTERSGICSRFAQLTCDRTVFEFEQSKFRVHLPDNNTVLTHSRNKDGTVLRGGQGIAK